jgi:hypothetical protein
MALMYSVQFVVKKSAAGGAGPADQYRQGARNALVLAASAHPKDILVPLANNFTLASGEQFEILSVQQVVGGTEGSSILQ